MTSSTTTGQTSHRRSLFGASTVLGYPRIGPRRELKWALEKYWAGRIDAADLERTAAELRIQTWQELHKAGIESVPSNVFSYYDHMLDAAVAVDAVPERFRRLDNVSDVDRYFAMARGTGEVPPLELTKSFNTNYHHLVPEIAPDTVFTARADKPLTEYAEAAAVGVVTRPVLVGPATFLLLSKAAEHAPAGFRPFDRIGDLVEVYARILDALAAAGVEWVQLDEPAYVCDRSPQEYEALRAAYHTSAACPAVRRSSSPPTSVTLARPGGPAGHAGGGDRRGCGGRTCRHRPARRAGAAVRAHDRRWSGRRTERVAHRSAGRRRDRGEAPRRSRPRRGLHVVFSAARAGRCGGGDRARPGVVSRLAFARQKVGEVVQLAAALRADEVSLPEPPPPPPAEWHDETVRARVAELRDQATGRSPYAQRVAAQADLGLPVLPATTIGSFPQTPSCARRGRICALAASTRPRTRSRSAPRSGGSSRCRSGSAWTCWCTGSRSATTWCSTSASSWVASPPPPRAGSSRTVPAASGLRSSTATSPVPRR